MYYVYVLKSKNKDFLYIGSTGDLKNRFKEHNSGRVLSTKSYFPLNLIYYEAYVSKTDALIRENSLKHHGGTIAGLKKRISNSMN